MKEMKMENNSWIEISSKEKVQFRGISVIVPFYNAEQTLVETCESLIHQKRKKDFKLDVILIDNNSSDDSVNMAQSFVTLYPDLFSYHLCEKQGVSNARNLGITLASTEYIMFLDADDLYSENTIQDVYSFFKEHEDETDIVFIPRFFMKVNHNERTLEAHPRNKLFSKTGVYEESRYHFNLYYMTLNIAIKNDGSVEFDPDIPYGEDTVFISKILGKNEKVGFVSSAQYHYRFSEWSTINKFQSPVYSAELILDNMAKQLVPYVDQGCPIPLHIQSMALNEIVWRYESLTNKLFPFHLNEERYRNWELKLRDLLRFIDDSIILSYPTLQPFHRYSILLLKAEPIKLSVFDNLDFRKKGHNIHVEDDFETIISNFKILDGKFILYGFLKIKLNELVNIKVYSNINGEENERITWRSVSSRYMKRDYSNYFTAYKIEYDLSKVSSSDVQMAEISIFYEIGGKRFYPQKYWFSKNDVLDISERSLTVEESEIPLASNIIGEIEYMFLKNFHFIIRKKTSQEAQFSFNSKTDIATDAIKLLRIEALEKDYLEKNIWLYIDDQNRVDNAFFQYLNDYNKEDGIHRYYIYKGDFLSITKYLFNNNVDVKFNEMNFVKFGSFRHKKLMLKTSNILSAFYDGYLDIVPFTAEELLELSDVLEYRYIYLQHGVLHAKAEQLYDIERTGIDKIVISSDFEKEVFTKELHYDPSNLLQVGMSRFDNVNLNTIKKNKILFAPSWRLAFSGTSNELDEYGNRKIKMDEFIHSQYYHSLVDILQSKKLDMFLEKNNLELDIKLHPIFVGAMSIVTPLVGGMKQIHIIEDSVNANEYLIFVTDFSSFVFDAVFEKMPIIYYELDREEFLAGNHSYRELYLGFEFGDVVDNVKDFIEKLEKIIKNNNQVEFQYLEKMNTFYHFPEHPREALYQELMALEEEDNG
jgi:glycosyltransferase involved in cell wall biosynthesis